MTDNYEAPLNLKTRGADQILTIYLNGKPLARYDSLGPQQEFYIPAAYLRTDEENLLAIILEAPGFYDELQSGYRRAFIYNPELEAGYIVKNIGSSS